MRQSLRIEVGRIHDDPLVVVMFTDAYCTANHSGAAKVAATIRGNATVAST